MAKLAQFHIGRRFRFACRSRQPMILAKQGQQMVASRPNISLLAAVRNRAGTGGQVLVQKALNESLV